jgi:hypothetical protein
MTESGQFGQNFRDKFTAMVIYLPFMRRTAAEFVEHYNNYKIRKQPDKPHIIGGKSPNHFYNFLPDKYHDFSLFFDPELLRRLREFVEI